MIFLVQRRLEDELERRRLSDPDQYAIRVANLYDRGRQGASFDGFLKSMHRLRTAFFRANPGIERHSFEKRLLRMLDKRFPQKKTDDEAFPGGVATEKRRLASSPRSIAALVEQFRLAVEARAVDVFWRSRKKGLLRNRPEQVAQALLAIFFKQTVGKPRTLSWEQVKSGVGFIDLVVILARTPHLVELKILKGPLSGVAQIADYMKREQRAVGWLIVFDVRPSDAAKESLPSKVKVPAGIVRIVKVDLNPVAPSRL